MGRHFEAFARPQRHQLSSSLPELSRATIGVGRGEEEQTRSSLREIQEGHVGEDLKGDATAMASGRGDALADRRSRNGTKSECAGLPLGRTARLRSRTSRSWIRGSSQHITVVRWRCRTARHGIFPHAQSLSASDPAIAFASRLTGTVKAPTQQR